MKYCYSIMYFYYLVAVVLNAAVRMHTPALLS